MNRWLVALIVLPPAAGAAVYVWWRGLRDDPYHNHPDSPSVTPVHFIVRRDRASDRYHGDDAA